MKLSSKIAIIAFTAAATIASPTFAQKALNIGPPPGPTPCIGFNCNQPPPNYGQIPDCYPPYVLVQINGWNGPRYECRFVNAQPIQPVQPIQPIQPIYPQQPSQFGGGPIGGGGQVGGGQYSDAHYSYCFSKYKSYRQPTNSYTAYSGETRYCNSPYN